MDLQFLDGLDDRFMRSGKRVPGSTFLGTKFGTVRDGSEFLLATSINPVPFSKSVPAFT